VLAAHGYPDAPRRGDVISGIPAPSESQHVFHAGTAVHNGELVTQGGRVLCVTALGDNVKQAQRHCYELLQSIHFDGMQYRQDIGYRAIATHSSK
jgi:phosphoribosylamine--glycine ligase